ncbi:hypothetical protein H5407_05060 [Mitsuaria sp. WAJ17]|uniref:STY0301 family protein n=1 Tax=Mitsuaria sp. WAJ17 TaxID=2761452 RepID=UPI0016032D96|nr:STY0301 family protein [Mitsuaria sp. WAJ17]MBB2484591.1 hypothetical protein [Mitsuaria sp. WAJ17]
MRPIATPPRVCALALCLATTVRAASPEEAPALNCPASLEVHEQPGAPPAAPWQAMADPGLPVHGLSGVSMLQGPPALGARLVPDFEHKTARQRRYGWTFSPVQAAAPAEEARWLACSYHHTALILVRPLPVGAKRCEVQEALLPTGRSLRIEGLRCD